MGTADILGQIIFVVDAVLYIVVAHLPSHDNKKCLQTLANVPWEVMGEDKYTPWLRTTTLGVCIW